MVPKHQGNSHAVDECMFPGRNNTWEDTYTGHQPGCYCLLCSSVDPDMWCYVVEEWMFHHRNNALWEETYTGHQPGCYCLPCLSVDPVVAPICDAKLLSSVCFLAAVTCCGRIHTLVIGLAVAAFRVWVHNIYCWAMMWSWWLSVWVVADGGIKRITFLWGIT